MQNVFIPERSISDNILLAQELFAGYNQQRPPLRCAMKVDLQKAYDTVEGDFLLATLQLFGFPPLFIQWIEECVTTSSFFVSLNGGIHGFFLGALGLRQGDPMSPYIFVLVMEVTGIQIDALLCTVISKDNWNWPTTRVFQCMEILQSLPIIHGGVDRVEWRTHGGRRLSIPSYEMFHPPGHKDTLRPMSTCFSIVVSPAGVLRQFDVMFDSYGLTEERNWWRFQHVEQSASTLASLVIEEIKNVCVASCAMVTKDPCAMVCRALLTTMRVTALSDEMMEQHEEDHKSTC
ncbi:UNVERIFIED_CONTAM: Transposon TX1 uncharacterized protein [Sesamum angustifolium]|uniref:Transposon TX1 uncharacterized protein n=1 Tax=Sesamum angustifolium TaxID=2727405 RepID=A0AAW2IUQ8_9LAMI